MAMTGAIMWLGTQANRLLRPLGLRVSRSASPADRRRARLMQRYGITTVIDIGANAGQYASLLRRGGYSGRIQSYEPLPDAFAQLNRLAESDSCWEAINKAVGAQNEPLTMHVAANSVSSSILPIADVHRQAAPSSATVGEISVECTRLDAILSPLSGEVVMVKADTQGLELPILRSAGELLGNVCLIELEMSMVELYSGQALFREVDEFLLRRRFELKSVEEGFFDSDSGELLQIDGIYANLDVDISRAAQRGDASRPSGMQ